MTLLKCYAKNTKKEKQFCLVSSEKHFFSPLSIVLRIFLDCLTSVAVKKNPQSYMVLTCWLLHAFVLRSLCRQQPRSSSEGAGLGMWLQEGGWVCQKVQVCLCCTLEPLRPKNKALLNLQYLIVIVLCDLFICLSGLQVPARGKWVFRRPWGDRWAVRQ